MKNSKRISTGKYNGTMMFYQMMQLAAESSMPIGTERRLDIHQKADRYRLGPRFTKVSLAEFDSGI